MWVIKYYLQLCAKKIYIEEVKSENLFLIILKSIKNGGKI